jgi:uncharacterized MAPEG superfamily protein
MTVALWCLVGWCAWAIFLVLCVAAARTAQVLAGKKRSNEFPSGTPHGGDRYWRLNRAHMNTVENLPIVATLTLVATYLHADIGTVATVAIAARVVQSLVHVSSGSAVAVNVRFTAFVTQLVCFGVMLAQIARHA